MLGHARGRATEDEPAKWATPMGADDDEVHFLGLGRGEDRLSGVALPHEKGGPDAGGTGTSHKDLGRLLDTRPFLIDTPQEPAAGKSEPPGVDDAEHDEPCA